MHIANGDDVAESLAETGEVLDDSQVVPAPSDPMAVAEHLMSSWTVGSSRTLRHWRGEWMRWERTHWCAVDGREIRAELYRLLQHASYLHTTPKGEQEVRRWAPSRRKMADLVEALGAITHLPEAVETPSWVPDYGTYYRARSPETPIVACTNGLLRVTDRELLDHDPTYFNLVSVPFDYDPDAPEPTRWREFLDELWPDDPDAIAALQEYFGYVLAGRTDLHKIMLIVGPARSGKGTIARILTELVGRGNMAGPTLASLATNFGLSPLMGKPLAVISDARLAGRDGHQVVERLLTISGEDTIDVDRKYREPWTGRLPTRFLILSNELPNFGDASGAIASRFVVLPMQTSWLGHEDHTLAAKLAGELPGILNWALDGLARLAEQGRFTEPSSSVEAVTAIQDTASPMSAFLRERCVTGLGQEIPVEDLWTEWKSWCEDNERRSGNKQLFGRNLQATAPQVRRSKPRDGDRRVPTYFGVALRADKCDTHNGMDRGPSRPSTTEDPTVEPLVRDGPRSGPLWPPFYNAPADGETTSVTSVDEYSNEQSLVDSPQACTSCGQRLMLAGRTECERCRLDRQAEPTPWDLA